MGDRAGKDWQRHRFLGRQRHLLDVPPTALVPDIPGRDTNAEGQIALRVEAVEREIPTAWRPAGQGAFRGLVVDGLGRLEGATGRRPKGT